MVKIGISFYNVGDLRRATGLYSRILGTGPSYADEDWIRFHLEEGDVALHLDPSLEPTKASEPVKFGAIVSLTVDDMQTFLHLAQGRGFTTVGDVQDLPYGFQTELRDPWGNRLSVVQLKEG